MLDVPETPAYVYDLAEVRSSVARLTAALPTPTGLYYSLKANPHPAVLETLRAAGVAPEVCSRGELDAALVAGWSAAEVLYTGPGKRDDDVLHALTSGVREFCVDSPHGLDQLSTLASSVDASVRTLLRVNDDVPIGGQGLAMTGVASQFGADTGWIVSAPEDFGDRPGVHVAGLHLYMGTNVDSVAALLAQFTRSLETVALVSKALAPYVGDLEVIDLGGGFAAPFARPGPPADLTGLRAGLVDLLDGHLPGWRSREPFVTFESGRHLVGTAGTLVVRVLDVKRSHGREVVVLESGINHLGGMSGLRRLPPINPTFTVQGTTPTIVTGPLCTPLDTWSKTAPLPPLSVGDVVTIPNVGAYGLYASLIAFLGHPCPVEVAIDGDQPPHVSRLTLTRRTP
ncbi:type III PLP-dependent enzyme [Actinokineospora sp. NBRC 105648]|uniref:type III PLP-dependent enzyme n=1 Tax=Actinokineospora sp. NBRC 105648 TaxID=3032206 RepID=UPI0024A051FF|nr:type III PLP-dependent enzyme [Actinokineospora sp. NBRC 105648]GLZ39689.1 diaminopimelate decarboxylase [Actinokineospora sp. NBRC 105648]